MKTLFLLLMLLAVTVTAQVPDISTPLPPNDEPSPPPYEVVNDAEFNRKLEQCTRHPHYLMLVDEFYTPVPDEVPSELPDGTYMALFRNPNGKEYYKTYIKIQ